MKELENWVAKVRRAVRQLNEKKANKGRSRLGTYADFRDWFKNALEEGVRLGAQNGSELSRKLMTSCAAGMCVPDWKIAELLQK